MNKVLLITSPDDTQLDGTRILLVDLEPGQTQLVSNALTQLDNMPNIIAYIWKSGESVDWLIDKKHKSDLIIFNADSSNQTLIGYMAAQQNSCYFGTLRNLANVNKSAIYTTEDCFSVITNIIKHDE